MEQNSEKEKSQCYFRRYVVHADDKWRAGPNCIDHLLSLIPYEDLTPKPVKLPALKHDVACVRPPVTDHIFVPEKY